MRPGDPTAHQRRTHSLLLHRLCPDYAHKSYQARTTRRSPPWNRPGRSDPTYMAYPGRSHGHRDHTDPTTPTAQRPATGGPRMNALRTWRRLMAFERDCFDVCCRLSYDPDERPTQDRIFIELCELRECTIASEEVDGALTQLLASSLITHTQAEDNTPEFTPTDRGRAVLIRRHQQLASLTVYDRTADMEVWK